MAEQIVRWCYYANDGRLYTIGVARYIAEQVDEGGQPLIGGKPLADERIGPPPEGFRPRAVKVIRPYAGKGRYLTMFSQRPPLVAQRGKTIQLREPDGSTAAYQATDQLSEKYKHYAHNLTPEATSSVCGWRYTTDQGYAYVARIATAIARQTTEDGRPLIGGRTASGGVGYPAVLTPRSVTLWCPETLKTRQLVVFASDAPLWTGEATEIQIAEKAGGLRTYRVREKAGELWRGRVPRSEAGEPVTPPETEEAFDSAIEAAFWAVWQRETAIPLARQHPLLGYRIDFAHLSSRTAIELDGYYYHADPGRFRKDRQRDRELAAQGWRVVRFAGEEVLEDVGRCVAEALRLIQAHAAGAGDPA